VSVSQAVTTKVRKTLIGMHDGEATDSDIEQLSKLLRDYPELAPFARFVVEQQALLELWSEFKCTVESRRPLGMMGEYPYPGNLPCYGNSGR
jgi:hypothetical protein